MSERPLLMTLAEAAAYLGPAETTVKKLVAAGRLAYVQLEPGGDRYIRRQDLEAFVADLAAYRRVRADVSNRARPVSDGVSNDDDGWRPSTAGKRAIRVESVV